jgi:hypothetical protein
VLRLRPEVRRGALALLERDQPALVGRVDENAAEWYLKQGVSDPELAAELVYHRLRLGDLRGAEEAWRDDCGKFLVDATGELPQKSRNWLEARLGVARAESAEAEYATESDAAERIRSARSRGHARAVTGILDERSRYADNSPLIFQDAYERWTGGDASGALSLLSGAPAATGSVARDRKALQALLLRQFGNVVKADALLADIEGQANWFDRPESFARALAIIAARIQLTVDFETELRLIEQPDLLPRPFRALSTIDVLLPRLSNIITAQDVEVESTWRPLVAQVSDAPKIPSMLARLRREEPALLLTQRLWMEQKWNEHGAWEAGHHWSASTVSPPVATLLEKSWRRWWLLSSSSFLPAAYHVAVSSARSALEAAVIGTLALFAFPRHTGGGSGIEISGSYGSLNGVVHSPSWPLRVDATRWADVRRILHDGVDERPWDLLVRSDVSSFTGKTSMTFVGDLWDFSDQMRAMIIHLMSPNPLEQLVHELAGRAIP